MADKKYTKLPVVNQTTTIKNFFDTTVEQLFSKSNIESISAYAGSKDFEVFVKQILHSLNNAEQGLIAQAEQKKTNVELLKEAKSRLDEKYEELVKIRNQEIADGKALADHDMRLQLQEAQLITNQLQWLLDISKNIRKTVFKTTSI